MLSALGRAVKTHQVLVAMESSDDTGLQIFYRAENKWFIVTEAFETLILLEMLTLEKEEDLLGAGSSCGFLLAIKLSELL